MISYRRERIMITMALAGWSMELGTCANGLMELWFSKLLLSHIHPATVNPTMYELHGRISTRAVAHTGFSPPSLVNSTLPR
jgi:hypothetical protein